MFHNSHGKKLKSPSKPLSINKNRGSALVIAIFVIIVISLLGAALVKMMASSQESLAFEVLGTRAYTAAQSGAQWQLSQVFPLNNATSSCINAETAKTFNNVEGLAQCEAKVSCSMFTNSGTTYYTITSIGECDIDGEKASREIEVEARSL
ncbi:hypothetical protein [Cognaticolwellia mytili]|uniref:hypothetical protein n=1 Tax=Cognaticolwellia mytili TaxID=1888913 RepID=UPI000A16ED66|nr:hypothetical protein [Cognaticolwellia mytili]